MLSLLCSQHSAGHTEDAQLIFVERMEDTPGARSMRGVIMPPGGVGAMVPHKEYPGREGETVIVDKSKTADTPNVL